MKHPIIAHGEYYIDPIDKMSFGGPKVYPHEYEEAKNRLGRDIVIIQDMIRNSKEVFLKEKIVCVRLEPKFEAKSYMPTSIIAETEMSFVGGRKYINEDGVKKAKLYFIKTSDSELAKLKNNLLSSQKDKNKSWRSQLCMINSIDLLKPDEKVMGFEKDWDGGKVEIILHPLGKNTQESIKGFFDLTGLHPENTAVRQYEGGLTFVCANVDKRVIDILKYYNPLRSIKPIEDDFANPMRMSPIRSKGPKLPEIVHKSDIKIGVFDGGVQEGTYLVDPFCDKYEMVSTQPNEKTLEHGSAVCGAILFGALNGKTETDVLSNPMVSVESFRVTPPEKTSDGLFDYHMYGTIDIIEKVVKERHDIKVFNLSLGPRGPILDDELSRFTYVCDRLSYDVEDDEVNPLFCVAVGNDGESTEPLNRIQSPADMVNGMAVGAYSFSATGDKERAPYSCIGPGREGAKTKPDLLEFGGSITNPFVGVMHGSEQVGAVLGTSFSTPVVAGKIGRLMACSDLIVPHLGRALLIQNAEVLQETSRNETGFGFCPIDVEELLECTDNKVTILYSGEITSSTSVRLPIFAPEISTSSGNTKIGWTICTVVNPNVNDPDAYTNNCIEDTFYPHEMTFSFTKQGVRPQKLNLLQKGKLEEARKLMNNGYRKSDLPISKPAKKYFREEDLRNKDFKWDTIIKKNVSMRSTSLLNPFLTLHAIGRDEYQHERIRYFAVVNIETPNYNGSLYDRILETYRELSPISIRNIERIQSNV